MDNVKSFKDMIKSCYTYGGVGRETYYFERYLLPYRKYFSEEKFNAIYNETLKDLRNNYDVVQCVYTDSEGCTYSSLIKK